MKLRRSVPLTRRPRTRFARRPLATAALAACAVLGLAGCTAVPGSGPVQSGLTDLTQAEQYVQFNPLGPVADSSQEDIVRGFVLAGSSSDENYAVAREFLAPEYADQWDPTYGVLVDEGSRPYTGESDEAGSMQLSGIAKVDADGRMLPVAPGASTDVRFEFERVNGEWRISSAPAGIILDRATFSVVWSSHRLYFVSSTGILVPEARWFLNRGSQATEIVTGLLNGPSERMGEVLHSGFPPGTALITAAVTVVEGSARVDLSGEALDAGSEATTEMYAQLRESLKSVSGVSGVELTIDGIELREPAGGITAGVTGETFNPAVMRNGEFGTVAVSEFVEMGGIGPSIAAVRPTAAMLAPDGNSAAVLGVGGSSRVSIDELVLVDDRPNQLAPSLDVLDYFWTVNRAGEVLVTSPQGQSAGVPAPWLAGASPVAVQISPDGSRIAVLIAGDDGRSVVLVAGIVRDDNGFPLRTTESADVQLWAVGAPLDLDWIDAQRFAVLSESGSSKVTIGGPGTLSADQGAVPDGVQVSSGGTRSQLRVLAEGGELYVSQGSGWQKSIDDVEVLAKRG